MVESRQLNCPEVSTMSPHTCQLCPRSIHNGDKETKQRKRLPTICIKCPQRADHCFWFPNRTVLAKPRTLETLLLANPYIPTLRHQCSRARSMGRGPIRPHASLRLYVFTSLRLYVFTSLRLYVFTYWWIGGLVDCVIRLTIWARVRVARSTAGQQHIRKIVKGPALARTIASNDSHRIT